VLQFLLINGLGARDHKTLCCSTQALFRWIGDQQYQLVPPVSEYGASGIHPIGPDETALNSTSKRTPVINLINFIVIQVGVYQTQHFFVITLKAIEHAKLSYMLISIQFYPVTLFKKG
jgi:hypothetical protein